MRSRRFVFLAMLVFAPCLAHAADVRVSYTVDERALKAAVSGTTLTFNLYTDSACATVPESVAVTIDDVDVIERLKRFKPTGGEKPPNTARLVESLTGVTAQATLFLTVAGTGVTPVGGACQLQYSIPAAGMNIPCLSQLGNEVYFDGCNVNVRNGIGSTDTVNGVGNLIVGYNEDTSPPAARNGSHNLVVGQSHSYSNVAGLVAGDHNAVSGFASSVTGGTYNVASGDWSAVTGGHANLASDRGSAVSGGVLNVAGPGVPLQYVVDTSSQSVSGGSVNQATGVVASVSGGTGNLASGLRASVSGGLSNTASGPDSSVSGGKRNQASASSASVSGGNCNVAGAAPFFSPLDCPGGETGLSSVTGGYKNRASGNYSAVTGGDMNTASGGSAVVSGGGSLTQANGVGWSGGSSGTAVHGQFSSP